MEIGSAADWFSGTASAAAVIVALGGYYFSVWQRNQDKREAQRQASRQIGIKLRKLLTGTQSIHRYIWAENKGEPLGNEGAQHWLWQTILPLTGLHDDPTVNLDAIESNLLIEANATDFLMEMIQAAEQYQSIVSSMKEYKIRCEAIQELFPPPQEMNGDTFGYELTERQYMTIQPYSIALDRLIQQIRNMTAENNDKCKKLAHDYKQIMNGYFNEEKPLLVLVEPTEKEKYL